MAEPSKSERAFHLLRRDILDARLAPGVALTIASLEQRYDLGWTPLREALSRLETERLVTFSPNRGYRVAGASAAEMEDLQKARAAVETALLREAIRLGDEQWEQRLVAAHYSFKQAKPLRWRMPEAELARWEQKHEAFHQALLSGSPSLWLSRFAGQINDQLHRHHRNLVLARLLDGPGAAQERYSEVLARASSIDHHTLLMEAALARKENRALALLAEHIGFTLRAFEALMPAGASPADSAAVRKAARPARRRSR
jgi:GntR family carbon starvation induced transcriptional regulator